MEINSMLLIIFLGSFVVNFPNVNTFHNESSLDDFLEEIANQMYNALWMIASETDKYQEEVENKAKHKSKDLFEKFEKLKRDFGQSARENYKDALKTEECKEEQDISEKFIVNKNKTKLCIKNATDSAKAAIKNAEIGFFKSAHEIFQSTQIFSTDLKICDLSGQFECEEKNKNYLILSADALAKKGSEQVQEMQKIASVANLEHCQSYYENTLKAAEKCFANSEPKGSRYRRSVPHSKKEEKKIQHYKEKYKKKLEKFSKEIDKEYQSGVNQLNENKNKMTNDFSNQIKDTKIYMESSKENSVKSIRNEWQKQQFSKCMENYEASLKNDFINDTESRASSCFNGETENGMKNMTATKNSFEDSAVIAVRKAKKNCKNKGKSCYSKRKIFEETCKTNSEEMKKNVEVQKSKMETCYNSYYQYLKEARVTYQYLLDQCFQIITSSY